MNPTIQILNEARHEIASLRRRNEILSAKVEVMDLFACVLHTNPDSRDQGRSIDIAWQLEKEAARLADLEKAMAATPCAHQNVTVSDANDGGVGSAEGYCTDCQRSVQYNPETRNWDNAQRPAEAINS